MPDEQKIYAFNQRISDIFTYAPGLADNKYFIHWNEVFFVRKLLETIIAVGMVTVPRKIGT